MGGELLHDSYRVVVASSFWSSGFGILDAMNTPASVRLTLHLGPVHAARLQRLADEAGVKRSDLIRRWIDIYSVTRAGVGTVRALDSITDEDARVGTVLGMDPDTGQVMVLIGGKPDDSTPRG